MRDSKDGGRADERRSYGGNVSADLLIPLGREQGEVVAAPAVL
jgi:hypothetical protein